MLLSSTKSLKLLANKYLAVHFLPKQYEAPRTFCMLVSREYIQRYLHTQFVNDGIFRMTALKSGVPVLLPTSCTKNWSSTWVISKCFRLVIASAVRKVFSTPRPNVNPLWSTVILLLRCSFELRDRNSCLEVQPRMRWKKNSSAQHGWDHKITVSIFVSENGVPWPFFKSAS